MPQTCVKDRSNVITLYRKSIRSSQISKFLIIHKSNVSRVFRRFLERGTLLRKVSPGRPRKCTKFTEQNIVRRFDKKSLTASEITQTLPKKIAHSTVREILNCVKRIILLNKIISKFGTKSARLVECRFFLTKRRMNYDLLV